MYLLLHRKNEFWIVFIMISKIMENYVVGTDYYLCIYSVFQNKCTKLREKMFIL